MKAPKKKAPKAKKTKAPKRGKKEAVKKRAKKKPAKRKMAFDILSPENFQRMMKVTEDFTALLLWFHTQTQDFKKAAQRIKALSDTFRHRLLIQPNKEASPRVLKLAEKIKQLETYMVEVMTDFKNYVETTEEINGKALVLTKRILDEKKQDRASSEITKLAQMYAPVIGQMKKLKERCDSIPPMFDDIESNLKRDVN